jgi:hypothetical protein
MAPSITRHSREKVGRGKPTRGSAADFFPIAFRGLRCVGPQSIAAGVKGQKVIAALQPSSVLRV